MSQQDSRAAPPLLLSRHFAAPRATVFRAWSSAEHMRRWFCPDGFTVPEAEIDCRAGGVCNVCMRSADGIDIWSRGKYLEVVPPARLVLVGSVITDGTPRFSVQTTVTFAETDGGTLLTVHQTYDIDDPAFTGAAQGAPEGWRTTLDKLAQEVARIGRAVHDSFTIERRFDADPATVFRAFVDPAAKARWFSGGEGYTILARRMDVRDGGREHVQGRWDSGAVHTFDAVYFDVVADRRLVYAYEMHIGDRRISVSLATLVFHAEGNGTLLVVTEHGTFLDGYDDAGSRRNGTGMLLDRLGAALDGSALAA